MKLTHLSSGELMTGIIREMTSMAQPSPAFLHVFLGPYKKVELIITPTFSGPANGSEKTPGPTSPGHHHDNV